MEKLEKAIRYNELLHIYGSLLSETQKDIATSYFEYDLSLSEIAEEKGISRAAVEDAVKKSMSKLDQLENSLHILENNKSIEEIIKDLDDETKEKIEKVLNNYGI
ncbi:MAG: hypothetical protein MJZ37_04960 [Bacilli bacterium]|nr:hypothetical protein [Bacilli bacterium]